MTSRLREKTNGYTVTPSQFTKFAVFAAALLTLVIATGAGVRLTDSGLGCESWPNCVPGELLVPAETHSFIEFGNRVFSGLVTLGVLAAAIAAMRRRPFRRDLAILAWMLPLGAFIQAGLGAMSVKSELAWEWVVAHFAMSMIIQIFAVALVWRSMHEPSAEAGAEPRGNDRSIVWSIRGLVVLTAAAWISGMGATATGPHAGGKPGQDVAPRWEPQAGGSLEWAVNRHGRVADVLGILAIGVWLLLWKKRASRELRTNSTVFVILLGIQGLIGSIQWDRQLPAELVWLHVVFAVLCWTSVLWFACAAGKPIKQVKAASSPAEQPAV